MPKRTPIAQRALPVYTKAEEAFNTLSHASGVILGIITLILCAGKQSHGGLSPWSTVVYGLSMICMYAVSAVYHGMPPCYGKKVMQIVDHCVIYFLIAGTYTPIMYTRFVPRFPALGWGMIAAQWGIATLAATLTAIDLKKYNVFSMICYIFLGWGIILFLPQALEVLPREGFLFILWGGIAYTVGAILYGIGSKKPWFHGVFHLFVLLGSALQAAGIYLYVL